MLSDPTGAMHALWQMNPDYPNPMREQRGGKSKAASWPPFEMSMVSNTPCSCTH